MRESPQRRRSVLVVALFAGLGLGVGPCGPIPGGALPGGQVTRPIDDWSMANDVARCAVEVRPAVPHSVTVNCMSWEGRLYVSCSLCERKRWARMALEDPRGRVRVGERVHPVELRRVEDPAELDAVWQARARKLESDPGPRAEGWWTFELRSR